MLRARNTKYCFNVAINSCEIITIVSCSICTTIRNEILLSNISCLIHTEIILTK